MGAIIFNIGESVKLSAFNILQEPIKMLMENEKEAFEKESILPKIYTMRTMDKYQEEYRSSTKMGNFNPTEDMEPASLLDFEEGYGKIFRTQIWTAGFVVSKQTIEDNQDMNINQQAMGFIRSYNRTRELYGHAMLVGALTGSCKFGDAGKEKTFDCHGMDTVDGTVDGAKQVYFHNAHKSVIDGVADQSNKFRASIDLTAPGAHEKLLSVIGTVETSMMNYTDYNGNPVLVAPTRILIPNYYAFKDCLLTALKTQYTSAMGENGVNLQYGKWDVVVSPYLNGKEGFTEADQAFIMIDPRFNRDNLGAVWFDRKPLEVDSYMDKGNKANVWDGRARYGAGFADFRAMAYVSTKKLASGEVLADVAQAQNATPIDVNSEYTPKTDVTVVGTVTTKAE